jgi:hypothetical protein
MYTLYVCRMYESDLGWVLMFKQNTGWKCLKLCLQRRSGLDRIWRNVQIYIRLAGRKLNQGPHTYCTVCTCLGPSVDHLSQHFKTTVADVVTLGCLTTWRRITWSLLCSCHKGWHGRTTFSLKNQWESRVRIENPPEARVRVEDQ